LGTTLAKKIHGVLGLRTEAILLGAESCSFELGDTVQAVAARISNLPSRFLQEQKLFLEAMQPAEDAPAEELESFNDLTKKYEENCKEHKTQLEIAAELVNECEKLGFKKDAYVLDGAFLDKDLMERIEGYKQAWVTRLAKSRLVQVSAGGFATVDEFAKTLTKKDFTRTVRGEQFTLHKNISSNTYP